MKVVWEGERYFVQQTDEGYTLYRRATEPEEVDTFDWLSAAILAGERCEVEGHAWLWLAAG